MITTRDSAHFRERLDDVAIPATFPMMRRAPDFDRLRELSDEARALRNAGELTEERFDAIFTRAVDAVGDFPPYLEGLMRLGAEMGFSR